MPVHVAVLGLAKPKLTKGAKWGASHRHRFARVKYVRRGLGERARQNSMNDKAQEVGLKAGGMQ